MRLETLPFCLTYLAQFMEKQIGNIIYLNLFTSFSIERDFYMTEIFKLNRTTCLLQFFGYHNITLKDVSLNVKKAEQVRPKVQKARKNIV